MHIIGLDFCPQSDRIWHHRQPSSESHSHRKYGSILHKATPSYNQGTPQSLCVALGHQGIFIQHVALLANVYNCAHSIIYLLSKRTTGTWHSTHFIISASVFRSDLF